MIKRISFIRRKPELSREAFIRYWMGPHAEIVKQLPGLRGMRFGVMQRWVPESAAWDGVGELWFDSMEAADKAFATEPHASRLREDRPKFIGETQVAFVEEHTVVAPPA